MRKRFFLAVLETFLRLGLGALFVYSAWTKIADPDEFAYSVSRYQFLPEVTIGLFSLTMPMLELLAGLAILFTRWLRESALIISVMLAMFIVALAQALARGLEISCGCFGVPSVGGRQEILMALARDVVLTVPALWLMFRPNVWIEPLRRLPRRWRAICQWVLGIAIVGFFMVSGNSDFEAKAAGTGTVEAGQKGQCRGVVVSSGPIRPGEWNVDFAGVRAQAEREQRPMVVLVVGKGCRHCARLEEGIAGEAFRFWRKDRAPLMAFVRDKGARDSSDVVKKSIEFVQDINKKLQEYPYVGVYWPQAEVTNRVAFCGRRGIMGGRKHKLLVMEFMSALDRALRIQQTEGRKTLESMVKEATVQISVRSDGKGGTVTMTPESGLLPEGKKVELVARPDAGYAFLDWRRPDGSLAGMSTRLTVRGGMQVGCYTARFKSRSRCLPPELISPATTSLYVRAMEPFRYAIKVSEACLPVSFKLKRKLPSGLKMNPVTGVVSGYPQFVGTNTVTIVVVGFDQARTELPVHLTMIGLPFKGFGNKGVEGDVRNADDKEDSDEEIVDEDDKTAETAPKKK